MDVILNKVNKKIFLKDVGKNIKKIRKEKKMTQLDLAMKCNTDVRKIGGTERGQYDFRISSIMVIANGLDINAEELIDFKLLNLLRQDIWLKKVKK